MRSPAAMSLPAARDHHGRRRRHRRRVDARRLVGAPARRPRLLRARFARPASMAVAKRLGIDAPIREATPDTASAIFPDAVPVLPIDLEGEATPGRPDPAPRQGGDPVDRRCHTARLRRQRSGRRHQPRLQAPPLRGRLRLSGPDGVCRRADRSRRPADHAAGEPAAARRAADHSSAARRGDPPGRPGPDRRAGPGPRHGAGAGLRLQSGADRRRRPQPPCGRGRQDGPGGRRRHRAGGRRAQGGRRRRDRAAQPRLHVPRRRPRALWTQHYACTTTRR